MAGGTYEELAWSDEKHGNPNITLSEADGKRAEADRDFAEGRKYRRFSELLLSAAVIEIFAGGAIALLSRDAVLCMPWLGVALVCSGAALEMRLLALRSDDKGHGIVRDLENGLDADEWQTVMGRPHPWKVPASTRRSRSRRP